MRNHYYKTCDNCGANLDPNETCDCQKMEPTVSISETFIVGFDSCKTDKSCLQVSKVTNGTLRVTNVYYGREAEELYNKLVNTL